MVIGIDGVPYELIKDFTERGVMPNFKRLIKKYNFIKTQVPLPEISSVSWTSFMTGMNPGEHGVYGFMEINNDNYGYKFPTFPFLPVKTIWERIEKNRAKSIIINLPNTYPVRKINGYLVSGFVALDLENAVYPKDFLSYLKEIDYKVDVDTALGKKDKKYFLKELHETLDNRYLLYKKLIKEKWNLFYFIITGTDRLHHFLFKSKDNSEHPNHNDFIGYYKRVDEIIGEITNEMENKGIPFIILSDHGFTSLKYEVYISQYLKAWGYLGFNEDNPKNLKSINENSTAFALDPSRIYIHLEGKYGKGKVKKGDYDKIRKEIKEKFLSLEIENKKVIKKVYFKEEIYKGGYFDKAPDIILLSNYGFDLKAGITKKDKYSESFFEGMHSQDNALLLDSYGLKLDNHPFINDIGKQVEEYFG
jgi:predicted AlkP superfamily phosphohydrolase/phosphomutase